jgi:hypothetical protein
MRQTANTGSPLRQASANRTQTFGTLAAPNPTLAKASEEELTDMEGGDAAESVRQQRANEAELGLKEAELEKASEEALRHMEGDTAAESARKQKP